MYSNFLNHHQLPLCRAFKDICGAEFYFVACSPVPKERLSMGYHDMNEHSFVIREYESDENKKHAMKLAMESDLVIWSCDAGREYLNARNKLKKLTFNFSERIFKGDYSRLKNPKFVIGFFKNNHFRNPNVYLLCLSAYAYADYALIHAYKNKAYKWGYFPEVFRYDTKEIIESKKSNSLLWVGRLLSWKHPEYPVLLAERLKKEGIQCNIVIIGTGPMKDTLEAMVREKKIGDIIRFKGSMPPEEVRRYMENSEIFLFTSDYNEGWGAVLNEAMNSCCACVVSHAAGSVGYLLKNNVNGAIYNNGDFEDFYNKVKMLLFDKDKAERFGKCAYKNIVSTWNADTAAQRLIDLAETLKCGKEIKYDEGPCSRAEIIKNNWYKSE